MRDVVAAVLTDRPLCLRCIADALGTTTTHVADVLTAIATPAPRSLCHACGNIRMTYRMGPATAGRGSHPELRGPGQAVGPTAASERRR